MASQHGASISVYPFRKNPTISFEHVLRFDKAVQQSVVLVSLVLRACNHVARSKTLELVSLSVEIQRFLAAVGALCIRNAMTKSTKMQ